MTLKQLSYFVKLSSILNYTQTAKELYISQPSLSYTMNELESELSVKLFERDPVTNATRLTEPGELFLSYVKTAFENLDDGVSAMHKYSIEASNTLNIGYIHTFPLDSLKDLFRNYLATSSSDVSLQREVFSSNTQLLSAIKGSKLNFAFSLSLGDGVDGIPYYNQDLFIIVSKQHPFGDRSSIKFEELMREPCIRIKHAFEINNQIDNIYHQYGKEPVISFQADNMNAALAYVMDYNCYTVAPILATTNFSKLTALTIEGHSITRPIYFSWKKNEKFNKLENNFYKYVLSHKKS